MLITLARKPLIGSVVQNCLQFGTGALNVDASRIAGGKTPAPVGHFRGSDIGATGLRGVRDGSADALGRWPANVLLAGSATIELTRQSGITKSPASYVRTVRSSNQGIYAKGIGEGEGEVAPNYGDTGSASRFFKQIKSQEENH